MKKIILDTNAISFLFRGDKNIKSVIDSADVVYLPVIAIGELCIGYESGTKKEANFSALDKFIKSKKIKVLGLSTSIAKIYGKIVANINKVGTPIPSNDSWIAACAIETDSTLVTYDRHFLKVSKVKLWKKLNR